MAEVQHNTRHGVAGAHAIYRWAHANQAARFAETVVADDRGKVSWQQDDNTFWVLRVHGSVGSAAGWRELDDVAALAAAAAALSAANTAQTAADEADDTADAAQATANTHASRHKADGADPILPTIIDESTTARTLALADASDIIRCTNAGATGITVPTNASVAFPIGTMIAVAATTTGAVTIIAAGGVTINPPHQGTLVLAGLNARCVLVKIATDTWQLWGRTVPA